MSNDHGWRFLWKFKEDKSKTWRFIVFSGLTSSKRHPHPWQVCWWCVTTWFGFSTIFKVEPLCPTWPPVFLFEGWRKLFVFLKPSVDGGKLLFWLVWFDCFSSFLRRASKSEIVLFCFSTVWDNSEIWVESPWTKVTMD